MLGRPVRAVARDEYGETALIIHPDGSAEPVPEPGPSVMSRAASWAAAVVLFVPSRFRFLWSSFPTGLRSGRVAGVLGVALVATLLIAGGWMMVSAPSGSQTAGKSSSSPDVETTPQAVRIAHRLRIEPLPVRMHVSPRGGHERLTLRVETSRPATVRVVLRAGTRFRRVLLVSVRGHRLVSVTGVPAGLVRYRASSSEASRDVAGSVRVLQVPAVVRPPVPVAVEPEPSTTSTPPAPKPKSAPKKTPTPTPVDPSEPKGPIDPDDA
ncbi:hypothetical protein ASD30_25530 [Nocardioides sp. Root140]|nr:hypothetical protein ASD30_25530 [Nocardioides sp. Root140]